MVVRDSRKRDQARRKSVTLIMSAIKKNPVADQTAVRKYIKMSIDQGKIKVRNNRQDQGKK